MQVHKFESQEERLNFFYERYGWDGKFFLLTRDHTVEITTVGGGYDDVDIYEKGSLFHYANQVLYLNEPLEKQPDEFGRNYLDRVFIALCTQLHCFLMLRKPNIVFKSLVTRKEDDKYIARVQYDDIDVEMDVEAMYRHFTDMLNKPETWDGAGNHATFFAGMCRRCESAK